MPRIVVAAVMIGLLFGYGIPQVVGAGYGEVFAEVGRVEPVMLAVMIATWAASLWIYVFALTACLPGLTHPQGQVLNLAGSAVSNVVPFGGALGVGATYTIGRSWGFSSTTISVEVAVTGLYNFLTKLALPVVALAGLALQARANPSLVAAAATGLVVFVVTVGLLVVVERSEESAVRIGAWAQHATDRASTLLRARRRFDVAGAVVRFRAETFHVLRDEWSQLTAALLGFKMAQLALLWLCVTAVGRSPALGVLDVFAAYAFGRILSAVPITPGGVGFVETGSIAALVALGGDPVGSAAAVLLFSGFIYLLEIPVGALAWVVWAAASGWRRDEPRLSAPSS